MWKAIVALAGTALSAACTGPPDPVEGRMPSPVVTRPSAAASSGDIVLVYQLRKSGDGFDPRAYLPSPRPASDARTVAARLQVALAELVEGPAQAERRTYTSAFSRDTAGLLLRVELRGNRAVVDFRDFRSEHPGWGTSYGGSVFLTQLNRTVFQFGRVKAILYRIERSCTKFWEFLEGACQSVRR